MSKQQSSMFLLALGIAVSVYLGNLASAVAGIECPCQSSVSGAAGVIFACPQGDGDLLSTAGLTISVTVRNCFGPVVGIPATDIWLIGCPQASLALCGGRGISASGPTDANGQTTITGVVAGGGCSLFGVSVVAQGTTIGAGVCGDPCIPIKVKSADINGDFVVNLVDFAIFGGASGYPSPPKPYNECIDYTAPFGTVTLADYAKYGLHSNHAC